MLELRRKILHIIFGIIIVVLLNNGMNIFHILSILAIGGTLSLISARCNIPFISWMLKVFGRKDEHPFGKGALTFVLGTAIVLAVFGNSGIAYASIIILTLGDSTASIIGRRLKKTRYLRKTHNPLFQGKLIEGTLFGIVFATLGACIFVSVLEAFLASSAAMIIEGIEIKLHKDPLDDNILVPLVAAAAIFVVRLFF